MINQLMLDCETLGTSADSVIMSIGAVLFDLESDAFEDDGFYASISIDSNTEYHRKISEDTLVWWMGQSPEAQKVFHEPKCTLQDSLFNLSDWIGNRKVTVWSNGADFDIPMLAHAFKSFGMETPWDYFNSRCVRTWKNLPGARFIKVDNKLKHNALADCIAQVQLVQRINSSLFSKIGMRA